MLSKLKNHQDTLALVISLVAVLISYLGYREIDSVAVRAVTFVESSVENAGTDVELIFTNGGNLPYLISKIEIEIHHGVSDGGFYPSISDERFAEVPFVLDKGAMKILKLTVPMSESLLDNKRKIPVHLVAKISAVDVHGKLRKARLWYGSFCLESETIIKDIIKRDIVSISDEETYSSSNFDVDPCN